MLNKQKMMKKENELAAKKDMNLQADMWKKERKIWQEEDERLQKKIRDINQAT